MYLSQTLNINLTAENSDILKRPSKVFNKIKSLFSGDMTPTEQDQAEVMLSVLQRLNVALRNGGFERLVSIVINDEMIYEDNPLSEKNLHEGNEAVADKLFNGNVNRIDSLSLTVDGEYDALRYLIHVFIRRKPKKGETPVRVDVYGFINEFKKRDGESEMALAERVKSLIATKWSDENTRKVNLDSLEQAFESRVAGLQAQIDNQFPAKSTQKDSKRLIRQNPFKSHYANHRARYDNTWAYCPIFFNYYSDDAMGDELTDLNVEVDHSDYWDHASSEVVTADSSSWTDSVSFSDSSGGSSCGSSCGGGCGS